MELKPPKGFNVKYVWGISPYYTVIYEDGDVRIFSSSHRQKGRQIRVQENKDGYLRYKINNIYRSVHQIVSDKFLGVKPEGLVVNHKDGDKKNNRYENLEYITITENIRHAIENGLHVCCDPNNMPTYKDGRTRDIKKYKRDWYHKNKNRNGI